MVLTDGYVAVISVEPEPDNSPGPFTLKPLVDMTIEDVGAGVPQDMMNNAAGFPTAPPLPNTHDVLCPIPTIRHRMCRSCGSKMHIVPSLSLIIYRETRGAAIWGWDLP